MKISKYFKTREFACKNGCGLGLKKEDISSELIEVLEDVREYFKKPVIITSGLRCKTHNRNVGGAKYSKHLEGIASDIVVRDISPKEVYEYLDNKYPDKYGIGRYRTFTHIDVRENKARF